MITRHPGVGVLGCGRHGDPWAYECQAIDRRFPQNEPKQTEPPQYPVYGGYGLGIAGQTEANVIESNLRLRQETDIGIAGRRNTKAGYRLDVIDSHGAHAAVRHKPRQHRESCRHQNDDCCGQHQKTFHHYQPVTEVRWTINAAHAD